MSERFVHIFIVCFIAKIPDFLTTWFGFSLSEVLDVKERNPVAGYVIKTSGFGGLFIYLLLVTAATSLVISCSSDRVRDALLLVWIVSGIVAAALNLYGIMINRRQINR